MSGPQLSEFKLLRQICSAAGQSDGADPRVRIGPGDDLAMVMPVPPCETGQAGGGASGGGVLPGVLPGVLLGVDQLIDGIHVDLASTPLQAIGHKAVARSLSDIAAMAARPLATLVSVCLPSSMTEPDAWVLFEAMKATAARYHAPLVGGDISIHTQDDAPLSCSVTVAAIEPPGGVVSRFGGLAGDGLYVTGELGGAWAGDHHLSFEPRLAEASMLKAILGDRLRAMIDISDGLGRDAAHLMEQGDLQIVLDASAIPIRTGATLQQALSDGEDYELLFAVSSAEGDIPVPEGLGRCRVTRVGTLIHRPDPTSPTVVLRQDGQDHDVSEGGWEHRSP